jgi:hypothetical protein
MFILESKNAPKFLTTLDGFILDVPMVIVVSATNRSFSLDEKTITSVLSVFNLSMFVCIQDTMSDRQLSIRLRASVAPALSFGLKAR